ncbi:MarR family winged helix-turn-helix transcriptional regulator [Hymenobacter wooponensis]|uniref:Uncharacterized protein n=1 Tax=Hymenobacter wooponensis TaxID=1525360 RepID=A0A4Z0MU57_9BACT|nr:MarR family winged helix-turn-helix transcriptional regulator [Hymenobacter wooponensis]TGD82848.1 hypothetical protein EU557_03450 [Hymenobacter wooponensis]
MTTAPNRYHRAETAGGSTPPTLPRRMYPIRQAINQIRGLRSEPKSVLVEVCELHENGKRRQCDATNSYLAERLGMTGKNVSRLLSGLVSGGWLECDVFPHLANRRLLTPTPKTRALYVPEVAAALSPVPLSGDTPVLSGDTPEVGIPHPRSEDRVSPEVGIGSPQKWGDLSTTKNDHSTNKVEGEALRSALAAAEKKIQELVTATIELARSKAQVVSDLEEVTRQRDELQASVNANRSAASASHTGGGAGRSRAQVSFRQ